jgi:hypothetical protein
MPTFPPVKRVEDRPVIRVVERRTVDAVRVDATVRECTVREETAEADGVAFRVTMEEPVSVENAGVAKVPR